MPGCLVQRQKRTLCFKAKPERWSSSNAFMQWSQNSFVLDVKSGETTLRCVVFIVHASKTLMTLSNMQRCAQLHVHIVVLYLHVTDVAPYFGL